MNEKLYLDFLRKNHKLPIIFYCKDFTPKSSSNIEKLFSDYSNRYKTENLECRTRIHLISKIINLDYEF